MNHTCVYCAKEIKGGNLNHNREVICPDCVQRLIPPPKNTQNRHHSLATARKVRTVGGIKGKKPPTGVR